MFKLAIDLLGEMFGQGLDDLLEIFSKDHEVNAKFGNPHSLISKRNKGWCIDGKRFLDMDTSRRNLCVVAGSGKGKSQVHVLPTILNSTSSMVVNDNSGELATTAAYLESKGTQTLIMDLTRKGNVYLNPLDSCREDVAAMRKVAGTLMNFATDKKDFFSLSGEDCITLFIQYVLESEPRIYANLGNVYRLILAYQGSPRTIERLMANKASEAVWIKFKALAGNSERTLKSITATALSALSWLGDNPILCDLTSVTTVKFKEFRRTHHVLFIQSPASDASFYAPMVSLVFSSFYRFAFSGLPQADDLDIMMVLDEFGSLVPGMKDFSNIISNARKFKIPQCIILQDESLLSPYGEMKHNILQNCFVKSYYGGQDQKAHELEKLLGSYTYTDKESGQKKQRPLLYASEIRELDQEILVLVSGQEPLKVKVSPAYKQSALRKKLAMQRPETEEEPITYSISYIDLSPYTEEQYLSNADPIE